MKQNQWKVEDVQQGNLEKLEKEKKKETKLFLNQIRKRPRFAQIFVDQYSLRDENVNKNIIEISKYLGRNLYDKKNLNMKIEKYLEEIDKKTNIMEENSFEDENSLNKDQILIHDIIMKNLAAEVDEDEEYHKMGKNEKEEIINLVKSGRKEKGQEEAFNEDFKMFQTFKQDVIKKEKINKSLGKTQFKNQIMEYDKYSGTKINSANNNGIHYTNKENYENYESYPDRTNNNYNNKNDFNNDLKRDKIEMKKKSLKKLETEEEILQTKIINHKNVKSADSKDTTIIIINNNKFSDKCSTEEINFHDNKFKSGSNFNKNLPPIKINNTIQYMGISNRSSSISQKENFTNTNNNIESLNSNSKGNSIV